MFIELHIIQNFPPSNLNRDDLGQPKETDFGGVRRARVSSQCFKREIRLHPVFEQLTGVAPSERTNLMVRGLVYHLLLNFGLTKDKAKAESLVKPLATIANELPIDKAQIIRVATLLAEAYAKKPVDADKTPTLIYLSESELSVLAKQVHQSWANAVASLEAIDKAQEALKAAGSDKKKKAAAQTTLDKAVEPIQTVVTELIRSTKERTSAPDIALYGRMLADRPETNVDAACQVAHAISTHAVGKADTDYYTAMDDIRQKMKDPGAGFLDTAYFNSACFYRYARINWQQLNTNLNNAEMKDVQLSGLALRTVEAFLRASEAAIPKGKKNAFAQEVRPSFMLAVLRGEKSTGWNMVNAFEKPVHATSTQGLVEQSVQRLQDRFAHHLDFYGDESVKAIAVALPDGSVTKADLSKQFADAVKNMNGWVAAMCEPLRQGA